MQPKHPGSPCTTPLRNTQRYQRISKMRRVRRERNTLEPLWWSVKVRNWTEMLFIVKLLPSTCCKQAVVSIILKETKCLLAWEKNLAFLCYWYILLNWSLQWGILNTRFFYYIMCKMWLDRANGFVKAGKLFSHNEFPTLYRSCYATIRMWISLRWSLPSFLMNITVPYISLRFTHLAHYSLESYLSRDEDFITNLNELPTVPVICTANTAGSDRTSIYTCT